MAITVGDLVKIKKRSLYSSNRCFIRRDQIGIIISRLPECIDVYILWSQKNGCSELDWNNPSVLEKLNESR